MKWLANHRTKEEQKVLRTPVEQKELIQVCQFDCFWTQCNKNRRSTWYHFSMDGKSPADRKSAYSETVYGCKAPTKTCREHSELTRKCSSSKQKDLVKADAPLTNTLGPEGLTLMVSLRGAGQPRSTSKFYLITESTLPREYYPLHHPKSDHSWQASGPRRSPGHCGTVVFLLPSWKGQRAGPEELPPPAHTAPAGQNEDSAHQR